MLSDSRIIHNKKFREFNTAQKDIWFHGKIVRFFNLKRTYRAENQNLH